MSRPSMRNVGRGGQIGIRFLFILATIGCLFAAATAWANEWDANGASPPNGTFQVANNWNPNAVPGTSDTATCWIGEHKVYPVALWFGAI